MPRETAIRRPAGRGRSMPAGDAIVRIGAVSMADTAYDKLKRRIIRCELAPGARTTEAELAAVTGTGKTPVREALTRLAHEGLVRRIRGHGYEITPITLADVHELFDFRLLIEPHAARLAAGRLEPDRLRHLDEFCGVVYSTSEPDSMLRFIDANRRFHVAVAEASGNRRLAAAVARVVDETARLFLLGLTFQNRSEAVAHEHRDLVEALVVGDADAAERHATEHILQSKRASLDALTSSPDVLSVSIGARQRAKSTA